MGCCETYVLLLATPTPALVVPVADHLGSQPVVPPADPVSPSRRFDDLEGSNSGGVSTMLDNPLDNPLDKSSAPIGLVGRDRELAHLDHVLQVARHGKGSTVVFRGEPGIGTSALIEATVARATDFNVVPLRGTALGGDPSARRVWPLPLDGLLTGYEPDSGNPVMGPSTDILPATYPSAVLAPSPDPDTISAAQALETMLSMATSPLLITIDDCHLFPVWFVTALVGAVTGRLSRAPISLVLASHDTTRLVSSAPMVAGVSEHRLSGFTLGQVGAFLRQQDIHSPSQGVLEALVSATGGNPQALIDCCSRLSPDEMSGWRRLPTPIPISDGLASAFDTQLGQFPRDSQLAVAITASDHLPDMVLAAVLKEFNVDPDVLRPVREAGILTEWGNHLEFTHPLVRPAAYQAASLEVRSDIHRAIARAFATVGNMERSAFHAAKAVKPPNEDLVRMHVHAGRIALDRGDPADAARHEEMASQFSEPEDAKENHLVQAASLWMTAGKVARSRVCLDRTSECGTPGLLSAEARYRCARVRIIDEVGPDVAAEMVAAADLCQSDTPHRAMLMLVDAVACKLLDGGAHDAAEIAERAVVLGQAVGNRAAALAMATLATVNAIEGYGHPRRRGSELVASTSVLISQIQRFEASPHLAYLIGKGLVQQGQYRQVLRWIQWIQRCATAAGDRSLGAVPLVLKAAVARHEGRLIEAVSAAQASVQAANHCNDKTMAARGFVELLDAYAAQGAYEQGFETASTIFALTPQVGTGPRWRALLALAFLEFQRGRTQAAFAWIRATEGEQSGQEVDNGDRGNPMWTRYAPAIAEMMILGRSSEHGSGMVDAIDRLFGEESGAPAWLSRIRELCLGDLEVAIERFRSILGTLDAAPLLGARVELSWGRRLLDGGYLDDARQRLNSALEFFLGSGAHGWAVLAQRELDRLARLDASPEHLPVSSQGGLGAQGPETRDPKPSSPGAGSSKARASAGTDAPTLGSDDTPAWGVHLFGTFVVYRRGQDISMPSGLAAQALKIVAYRQRVLVDELIELLWPDAEPGVGTRRLRNVLWRLRGTCGDLLVRDGNFIRLAPEAVTDSASFRLLGEQAMGRGIPHEEAVKFAEEALRVYTGELLPGDRYEDWAATPRESMARLHMQLLELLLADAVNDQRSAGALKLLDDLIEADPYEERYYVQAAEMLVSSGNRRQALSMIERARRVLADMGVPSSASLGRLFQTIGSGEPDPHQRR